MGAITDAAKKRYQSAIGDGRVPDNQWGGSGHIDTDFMIIKNDLAKLNKTDTLFFSPENSPLFQKVAAKHPNLYAGGAALLEPLADVGSFATNFAIDIIPGIKYLRSKDREKFMQLDAVDQAKAVLWEMIGAELWALPVGGRLLKRPYLPPPKMRTNLSPKPPRTPVEDTIFHKAFNYDASVNSILKVKGFAIDEIEAIKSFIHGNQNALKDAIINIKSAGKSLSKGFADNIRRVSTVPYGKFVLSDEMAASLERGTLFKNNFMKTLEKFTGDARSAADDFLKSSHHAPEDAVKWLATATPEDLALFTARAVQGADKAGASLWGITSLYPIRYVLGAGEKLWQTMSKVYLPIVQSTNQSRSYIGKKIGLFQEMMTDIDLGVINKKGIFKPADFFQTRHLDESFKFINFSDDLMQNARNIKTPEALELAKQQIGSKKAGLDKISRAVVDTWYRFSDHLYAEDLVWVINDAFGKAGMTRAGEARFALFMKELEPQIKNVFKSSMSFSPDEKLFFVKDFLFQARQLAGFPGIQNEFLFSKFHKSLMFNDLQKASKSILGSLNLSKEGRVVPYLSHYAARMSNDISKLDEYIFGKIMPGSHPTYTKARTLSDSAQRAKSFDQMIYRRVSNQASRMFMNDTAKTVSEYVSTLPESYRNYIGHWFARLKGVPSKTDAVVADTIQNSLRKIGIKAPIGARHIYDVTRTINDFTYMGILGLKPVSAGRNLFQFPINALADIGGGFHGIKGSLKGYSLMMNPKTYASRKQYLDSIGIITDFAPEYLQSTNVFRLGKASFGNIRIPNMQSVRDTMMWMFKNSDEWNRYVTGSAAMVRWENALKKLPGLAESTTTGMVDDFMKVVGANNRNEWIVNRIRDNLSRHKWDEAKAIYIKDVVGDTQYLYGTLDSPIITQTAGSFGRQAAVFQSWWMNYGPMMEKWLRTGKGPGGKAERMLIWAGSSAISYEIMKQLWGTWRAEHSVGFGPFKNPLNAATNPVEFVLNVPAWKPIFNAMQLGATAGSLVTGDLGGKKRKDLDKRFNALIRSSTNLIPAGSISRQAIQGLKRDEPFKGFISKVLGRP